MLRTAVRRGALWTERVAGSLAQLQLPGSFGPRSHSALPQPAYDSSEDGDNEAARSADDAAYRRMIQEMAYGQANLHAEPQPTRRRRSRASFPTVEQVAEQLKAQHGAGCSPPERSSRSGGGGSSTIGSSSIGSSSSPDTTLDWREVVAAMRAAQHTPTGEQMLTDTFG